MAVHFLLSVSVSLLAGKGFTFPVEISLIASEMTILVPSVIYILAKKLSFADDLGFRRIKPGTVIMSILLSCLAAPITSFVNVLSQLFVSNTMVQMSDTLLGGSGAWLMILGALYGPFCEEFVFRGVFFNRYEKYAGPMRAGLISSLFFALAHMNVNQAGYAFVLGMMFSVINKAAGSVFPSIIMHVCINGANLLLMIIASSMYAALGMEADFAASAEAARTSDVIYVMIGATLVVAIICALVSIPCIIWISKHENNHDEFYDMFTKRHPRVMWLTFPTVLGILFVLIIMFGMDPLLKLFGK